MDFRLKKSGAWWMALLLSAASLAAAGTDLRLVEAARKADTAAVRSLLKTHLDVNAAEGDGATALAWAAHWNDLEAADLLIRAGVNVNAANDLGVTPLSLACLNGSAAMIEKLLKAGADPNAALPTGETPLMEASRTGNADAVKSLLAHGVHVNAKESVGGQTALMWAVAEQHSEVARALVQQGADVRARSKRGFTPLLFAAERGDLDSARILLAAGANVNDATPEQGSALVVAAAGGQEALAIFLLDSGADPNLADGNGITSLHYAMLRGISILDNVWYEPFRDPLPNSHYTFWPYRPNMRGLVKALLAHGANPNARIAKDPRFPTSYKPNVTNPVGATPFLLAATTYDVDLMRALAASGADPRLAAKDKTTPLIMAAGLGERLCGLEESVGRSTGEDPRLLEAVKAAVELGADVNAANDSGLTALHAAAYLGSDTVIKFLAEKGAEVNAKDKCGQTALSIAEEVVVPGLSDLLKPHVPHKSTAELLRKLGVAPIVVPQETQLTKALP